MEIIYLSTINFNYQKQIKHYIKFKKMNKSLASILFITVVSLYSTGLKAQNKITEGKAVFSLEIPTEGMDEQYKAMMPTETTIYFKDAKSCSETTTAMMNMSYIYDSKDNSMVMLMDMMGNKTATKTDLSKEKKDAEDFKVEVTKETMKIAGYDCIKAIITDKEGSKSEIWFTKDVAAKNSGSTMLKGIEGFPMKYEIGFQGGESKMKMECKSIKAEKISDDKFVIPSGYTLKTQEEMMKGKD